MKIDNLIQSNNVFNNINSIGNDKTTAIATETNDNNGLSFIDTLKQKLNEVNDSQLAADSATEAFIKGDNIDIHQVMIANEEAKQSLEMAVQVRNKLVEAFQEINRMQL